jgi:2-polyprenyl-3-methyl-5-hydroxy-6-metoxy-1,4-benzoquinol methylase
MKQKRIPEVMDSPDISPESHHRALAGLARINSWSNSAGIVWSHIEPLLESDQTLRVLDVATGGGDVPIALWKLSRHAGGKLEISGCDKSPVAIEHAKVNAEKHGAAIRWFTWNLFTDPVPQGYDVIVSSLFMHHLDSDQAVEFLKKLAAGAASRLIVNDLRRSTGGWLLALSAASVLRSRVVFIDGPRSVRAAYTMPEAAELAARAGLKNTRIEPRFPFRFVMTWSRT